MLLYLLSIYVCSTQLKGFSACLRDPALRSKSVELGTPAPILQVIVVSCSFHLGGTMKRMFDD